MGAVVEELLKVGTRKKYLLINDNLPAESYAMIFMYMKAIKVYDVSMKLKISGLISLVLMTSMNFLCRSNT